MWLMFHTGIPWWVHRSSFVICTNHDYEYSFGRWLQWSCTMRSQVAQSGPDVIVRRRSSEDVHRAGETRGEDDRQRLIGNERDRRRRRRWSRNALITRLIHCVKWTSCAVASGRLDTRRRDTADSRRFTSDTRRFTSEVSLVTGSPEDWSLQRTRAAVYTAAMCWHVCVEWSADSDQVIRVLASRQRLLPISDTDDKCRHHHHADNYAPLTTTHRSPPAPPQGLCANSGSTGARYTPPSGRNSSTGRL